MTDMLQTMPGGDVGSALDQESSVRALERCLLGMPQVDLQTQMMLHGGMAVRTIRIPAGVALTGAKTKRANLCIVIGDISVTTDLGVVRLTGFHVIPADAGLKRVGYAHADTLWTTVWPTEAACAEDAEDEMTDESEMLQTRRDGIEFVKTMPLPGGQDQGEGP
jgi:hypothetical protein